MEKHLDRFSGCSQDDLKYYESFYEADYEFALKAAAKYRNTPGEEWIAERVQRSADHSKMLLEAVRSKLRAGGSDAA